MKRAIRILSATLAILVLLVVALTLFVKAYLTDERIRSLVTDSAEKSLNRKVSMGAIEVSLWKGVTVKDFEVREKDPGGVFLRTKDFILKYQLLPLLSKRLVVDELSVVEPMISIRKEPDGSFNFSDIGKGEEKEEAGKTEEKAAAAVPLSLDIRSISVRKGVIEYDEPGGKLRKASIGVDADLGIMSKAGGVISSEGSIELKLIEAAFKEGDKPLRRVGAKTTYRIDADMAAKKVTLNSINLSVGESVAEITGSIANYDKAPEVRLDVKAKTLDLDALLPPPPVQKAGGDAAEGKAESRELEPVKPKISIEGTVEIGKMLLRGVTFRDLRVSYELKEGIFRIASLTGNTLSGSFRAQSTVDLSQRGARYSLNAEINGIKIEDIAAAFAPKAKDRIFGSLQAKAEFSGSGTVPAAAKRNLKGKGSFSVKDGTLKNAEVTTGFLAILGLQDLREIKITKGEGNFAVSGGSMSLASLIENQDMIVDEKGSIGLLTEGLDIGINVKVSERLTPKLMSQPAVSQFLSEEKGWTAIPLRLGGTIQKPSYSIDTRALGRKATDTIRRRLGEELFRDKSTAPEKGKGSPGDLLKGLFGK